MQKDQQQKGLGCLVYGATGAVGRELVKHLLGSNNWAKVIAVVRRQLQEWKSHPNRAKLTIELLPDMDALLKPQSFANKYPNIDCVFCMFGSQVKHGQETFVKIDKTYPLMAAEIALLNKIPQYLIVSSSGANVDSMFLYMRTKGQVEEQLKRKELPLTTIMRPGLLANRHDARFGQKVLNCLCPCLIPKIQATECAQVLMLTAEKDQHKSKTLSKGVQLYQNSDMLRILDEQRKRI